MAAESTVRLVREGKKPEPFRYRFTKKTLGQLTATGRQQWVYDTEVRGLAMIVTPAGRKTFYLARRYKGKYQRIKIGPFPELTIEQARDAARKLIGEIAAGGDPAADRKQAREATTIEGAFEYFLLQTSKRTKRPKRPRTIAEYRKQYDGYLARWGHKRLSEVTDDDVERLHAKIGQRAPYQANRVLALIQAVYRVAIGDSAIPYNGSNPAAGVDRFPEQSKLRYLTKAEAGAFIRAADAEPNTTMGDLLLIALYTGARRGNVCAMKWADIDLSEKVWTIPAGEAKAGETIRVALAAPAVDILKRRRVELGRKAKWVFPSYGKAGHVAEVKSGLTRVCEAAGIKGLRFHDLRHTAASWAVNAGVPLAAIGRQLGHASVQTTAKYAHVDLEQARSAADAAAEALRQSAAGGKGGD